MVNNQIELNLVPMTDRNGKKYYGSFPDIPATLRLDEITFFVFVSDDGEETLVIRKREKKGQSQDRQQDRQQDRPYRTF